MAPMIEETMSAIRGLVSGAWCARRKEATATLIPGQFVTAAASADAPPKPFKHASDSEDNAEISTACPTCESDLAVGSTDGSTDGSDAEVDRQNAPEESKMPMWIPPPPGLCSPGVAPPPGLELPSPAMVQSAQKEKPQGSTRLTSQAAPFVPSTGVPASSNQFDMASQNLHQKLCQLKGALAEWEACMPKTNQSTPSNHVASASLQDMLNTEKSAQDLASVVSSFMATTAGVSAAAPGFPMGVAPGLDMLGAEMLGMDMTAGNTGFPPMTPQILNPQVAMMNNAAWPNTNAQPWVGSLTSPNYQQQSWQRASRPGGKSTKSQQVRTTLEESEADDQRETLRTNLRVLETMDASKIIIVRKINRLGLDSAAMLKAHYSQYGTIEQLFVSHSRVRSTNRVRPAGLGFLAMSTPEEAKAILNMGHEQIVKGVVITLQPYEDRVEEGDGQTAQATQFEFQ